LTQIKSISLNDVPAVIESGTLPENLYLKAAGFLRDEGFWKIWAIGALLALAVGHILSGIIFFFAYNWDDMAAAMKFLVVGSGIAACLLAWVFAKLDRPAGQAFGIGATVLVGVLFAVLGQVYQTPAMLHTPFVLWAVLTLPFALISKNLAHWTVWFVILIVAVTTFANSGLRLAGKDLLMGARRMVSRALGAGLGYVLVLGAWRERLSIRQCLMDLGASTRPYACHLSLRSKANPRDTLSRQFWSLCDGGSIGVVDL